jgi:hypothetical protein
VDLRAIERRFARIPKNSRPLVNLDFPSHPIGEETSRNDMKTFAEKQIANFNEISNNQPNKATKNIQLAVE